MKCAYCGAEFVSIKGQRRYCSVKCRAAAERARARQSKINAGVPMEWAACLVCERQFKRRVNSDENFCSAKCRQKAQVTVKKCAFCGKRFETYNNVKKYCSPDCADKSRYEQVKKYHAQQKVQNLTNKAIERPPKKLDDWAREAFACGLDYGTYRSLIERGKTFEELKAERHNCGDHSRNRESVQEEDT